MCKVFSLRLFPILDLYNNSQTAEQEANEYVQQQRDLGYAMPLPFLDCEKVLMFKTLATGNFDVSAVP